jgi:hypothetical protein
MHTGGGGEGGGKGTDKCRATVRQISKHLLIKM